MKEVSDITKYQEFHLWDTFWDTIGPYSVKTRLCSRSYQDCSNLVKFGKTTSLLMDCRRFRSISGSIFRTRSLGYDLREMLPINAKWIEESLNVVSEEP
jgi:hypothetical protein